METKYAIPRFHQANDGVSIYVNVAVMGASATQLSRLDTVQNAATALACVIGLLFLFSFIIIMLPQLDCC